MILGGTHTFNGRRAEMEDMKSSLMEAMVLRVGKAMRGILIVGKVNSRAQIRETWWLQLSDSVAGYSGHYDFNFGCLQSGVATSSACDGERADFQGRAIPTGNKVLL